MGTTPIAVTNISLNLKPQMATWGAIKVTKTVKNEDGTESKEHSLKAVQDEKSIEEARKKGTLEFEQSVSFDFPANDEGFKEIIPDAEERIETFIAGLKARNIGPRVRRLLEDYDIDKETGELNIKYQPVEGSLDIRDLIREAAKRKNLTPKEKAYKNLREIAVFSTMTDAQLDAIMASAPGLAGNISMDNSSESEPEVDAEQAEQDAATASV